MENYNDIFYRMRCFCTASELKKIEKQISCCHFYNKNTKTATFIGYEETIKDIVKILEKINSYERDIIICEDSHGVKIYNTLMQGILVH